MNSETIKNFTATSHANWKNPGSKLVYFECNSPFSVADIDTDNKSLWRYKHNIPINESNIVSLGEGLSPLIKINLGSLTAMIKQEQLFPTGSYKDRGATVMLSHARSVNATHVIQDSSGNAGCSVAAYSAAAKINCDVYVPEDTSPAKLTQIAFYGANLIKIPGDRTATAEAALLAAQNNYYASHCYNPYFYEGTKTFAYEICEQLNWTAPDRVILPAGNGTILIGAWLGFKHLLKSKIISHMPMFIAVQAEKCSPLYEAWFNNMPINDYKNQGTIAEGIAIESPIRGELMIDIIKATGGSFITVNEEEIIETFFELGKMGYYVEPTSAATIAGIIKLKNSINRDELVVSLFSGHGLKSGDKTAYLMQEKRP